MTSVIFIWTVLPTMPAMSPPLAMPDWEAGINTRMPLTFATRPPLFSSVMVPSTVVLSSTQAAMSSQTFRPSSFFLDSCTVPSWSLTRTTKTSISSPTFRISSGFTEGSLLTSS
ncbi:hypothetical protein EVA_10203 [gut metagenome]|uniref:Uncharacterized protein n=1 Tax=gut metagenome TaxID=749906 RepID=J9GP23_9ZZZZ